MANYLQLVLFYSVIRFAVSQTANASTADSPSINKCLFSADVVKCIQNNIFVAMDSAIQDNKTWYLNDYVAIEPNPSNEFQGRNDQQSTFMGKLEDLVQSRHIQLSLNPLEEAGRGRRRKNKHGGGMFLMSGLAVAAVVIQMVLGKIAFVAAAALVLAKIALFVSTTKSQHATTSSSNDHVIYTEPVDHYSDHHGGGGGGGSSSGWQRSILPLNDNMYDDTELQIEDYRGGKRRFR